MLSAVETRNQVQDAAVVTGWYSNTAAMRWVHFQAGIGQ